MSAHEAHGSPTLLLPHLLLPPAPLLATDHPSTALVAVRPRST